jgi:hypothetical protein
VSYGRLRTYRSANFRLPNFILHCTSNFATTDLTARMDSSTPSQILGDITFGSDRFTRRPTLLDPPSTNQQELIRRLSRCERYRGIIEIQSQDNWSIHRRRPGCCTAPSVEHSRPELEVAFAGMRVSVSVWEQQSHCSRVMASRKLSSRPSDYYRETR